MSAGWELFGPLMMMFASASAVLFALIFAVRNLRRNRADRKGAFRLAMLAGLLQIMVWLCATHHVAELNEWNFLANAIGDALYSGFVMWILYLALEPTVRARWPHAMVTWNRLLAGKFGDAQVGAHMLVGAAIGMVIALGFLFYQWLDFRNGGPPSIDIGDLYHGPMLWMAWCANLFNGGLRTGFIVFFTIFGFRSLLKSDYLAALATAILFGMIENNGIWNSPNPWIEGPLRIAIFVALTLVLLRMGMISTFFAIIFINSIGNINFGPGFNAWYTPYSLATAAMLIALAVYAFWRSIGARTFEESDVNSPPGARHA